jgi:hypothetical protein
MTHSQNQLDDLIVGILVKQFPEWKGRREEALRFVRDPENASVLNEKLTAFADIPAGFFASRKSSSSNGFGRFGMLVGGTVLGVAIGVFTAATFALAMWKGGGITPANGSPAETTLLPSASPPLVTLVPKSEIDAQIVKLQGDWERQSETERVVKNIRGTRSTVTYYDRKTNAVTAKSQTDFNVSKVGDEWRFVFHVAFVKGKRAGRSFRGQYTYRLDEGDTVFHEITKTPYRWRKSQGTDYTDFTQ